MGLSSKKQKAPGVGGFLGRAIDPLNTMGLGRTNARPKKGKRGDNQFNQLLQSMLVDVNQPIDAFSQQYTQPIERDYMQQLKTLDDNLVGAGQGGGSFAAYSKSLLDQNRDNALNQARFGASNALYDRKASLLGLIGNQMQGRLNQDAYNAQLAMAEQQQKQQRNLASLQSLMSLGTMFIPGGQTIGATGLAASVPKVLNGNKTAWFS